METGKAVWLAEKNKNNPIRVFDWHKAAELIKSTRCKKASAGLSQDWEWTGGIIFQQGKPVPREQTYTYLASNWAIPEISIDHNIQPCWVWQSEFPNWNSSTYWPDSALEILNR